MESKWSSTTAYPRLYALSQAKNNSVKDMWNISYRKWNIRPLRRLNDRETFLWNQISTKLPYPKEDKDLCNPLWKLKNNKIFITTSIKKKKKKVIQISSLHWNNEVDPHIFKVSWKSSIPKKCKFFLWSILYESINTMEVLQSRMPKTCLNPNWCVLCHSYCETRDHLLVNFKATSFLWDTLWTHTKYHQAFNNLKSVGLSLSHLNSSNKRIIIILNATLVILKEIEEYLLISKKILLNL